MQLVKRILPASLKQFLKKLLVTGANVQCVVCHKKFSRFLSFSVSPTPKRKNAQCPNCYSLERTRIYWWYLKSLPGFFTKQQVILHIAPERKFFELFTKIKTFRYHSIDKFEPGYDYPEATQNMDICAMSFADNHFDFILCSHVLEHVLDDIKAMKECYRAMKPGGWGILQVPLDWNRERTFEDAGITEPAARTKAFGQYDHVRVYGKDYVDRLKSVGFDVELDDSSKRLSPEERFRYGFGNGKVLCIVRKPL